MAMEAASVHLQAPVFHIYSYISHSVQHTPMQIFLFNAL